MSYKDFPRSSRGYQTLILTKGDVRAIEMELKTTARNRWYPDYAYTTVYNDKNDPVIFGLPAIVGENKVAALIGAAATSNLGKYWICWKLVKGSHVYLHRTNFKVVQ